MIGIATQITPYFLRIAIQNFICVAVIAMHTILVYIIKTFFKQFRVLPNLSPFFEFGYTLGLLPYDYKHSELFHKIRRCVCNAARSV